LELAMMVHDDSEWPLVLDRPDGEPSDEEVVRYMETHDAYLRRRELYGAVLDANRATVMTAKQRKMVTEWLTARHDDLGRWHVAIALVAKSPVIRGFLTAIYWVSPPAYPYKIFSELEPAKAWVLGEIAARKARGNAR
jgi:hypothetical protein